MQAAAANSTQQAAARAQAARRTLPRTEHRTVTRMKKATSNGGTQAVPTTTEIPRLLTQRQAATYLNVSPRYLRESGCPKLLLPGTGPRQRPLVRYDQADVAAWALARRAA